MNYYVRNTYCLALIIVTSCWFSNSVYAMLPRTVLSGKVNTCFAGVVLNSMRHASSKKIQSQKNDQSGSSINQKELADALKDIDEKLENILSRLDSLESKHDQLNEDIKQEDESLCSIYDAREIKCDYGRYTKSFWLLGFK